MARERKQKIASLPGSRPPKRGPQSRPARRKRASQDDVLAVINDLRTGQDYYVSLLDSFIFGDHEYAVMYNYEPDNGDHQEPELVVMRFYRDLDGNQYFTSIRDKKELEMVFEIFYERFARASSRS